MTRAAPDASSVVLARFVRGPRQPALRPGRTAFTLLEAIIAMTVVSSATVVFASTWSTYSTQAASARYSQHAVSLLSQQAELIRRKILRAEPTPWAGPTGPLHSLRAANTPSLITWTLVQNRAKKQFTVDIASMGVSSQDLAEVARARSSAVFMGPRSTTERASPWFLLNVTNIGPSTEPLPIRQQRLDQLAGMDLDIRIYAAAVLVKDDTGIELPAPPGSPGPTVEPRDAVMWQVDVLRANRRFLSSQFVTWLPIHQVPGEPGES